MNIVIIGWGSLIWCPGSLRIKSRWHADGPSLPIEFARISSDGRLTLVIHPSVAPQPTYWARSELEELKDARKNLKDRERCKLEDIDFYKRVENVFSDGVPEQVQDAIRLWLNKREDLDVAIWTGLTTNWKEKRQGDFTPNDAVCYLKELEEKAATLERTREYVRNTPPQIQTEVRKRMNADPTWADNELADSLFEPAENRRSNMGR